jgi:hypothetical protein
MMTSNIQTVEPASWNQLRSAGSSTPEMVISATAPEGVEIDSLIHLRTAHYAVYRAYDTSGDSWVARVGVYSTDDDLPADNSAHLGTSAKSPTGQMREHIIASKFHAVGAYVCPSKHYARTPDGFDALWLPFVEGTATPLNAGQWHRALASLHAYTPDSEMPVFTNRAKTFDRIDQLPESISGELRGTYDAQLAQLFRVASQWSVVHGDAHAGNAINTGERAVLFDLDTACWAPSVWDLTHLMNRAGSGPDSGYTASELRALFSFTDNELEAALSLRRTAALVAKIHREHTC